MQRLPGTDKGFISSEHLTRSKIADSLDGLFFIFYEKFPFGFYSGSTSFHSHQHCTRAPFLCILANLCNPLALIRYHRNGREATCHSDFDLHLYQCSILCLSVPGVLL